MSIDERIQAILIQKFRGSAASIFPYLSYRRNPNVTDLYGTTLLHIIASDSLDNLAIVKYLINLGANINVQDNDRQTPLHFAVPRLNYKIASYLIDQGAAVNIQGKDGNTALHLLIGRAWLWRLQKEQWKRKLSLSLIKKLLQSGADPNLPDIQGETPLMRAVRHNDLAIVKELLKFGGNVHLHNVDLDTSLHLLGWTYKPNKGIIVELLKHGACVNCFGSQGTSVMDFILRNFQVGGLEAVKLLIKTATLVNWKSKICFELERNCEFYRLEEFIDCCYKEVSRMKSCTYSDNSNLCHFALNGGNAAQTDESSGKTIFNEVLETLMKDNFPIYDDFIYAHFNRSILYKKASKLSMYARNKETEKAVHLNSDLIMEIASYLLDKDLYNLIKAYSKPGLLYIKNDKISRSTDC